MLRAGSGIPDLPPKARRNVLIAVDPDTRGAIAVATWATNCAVQGSQPVRMDDSEGPEMVDLSSVSFKVTDFDFVK